MNLSAGALALDICDCSQPQTKEGKPTSAEKLEIYQRLPEFDQIFGRVKARKVKYWADPMMRQEGKISHQPVRQAGRDLEKRSRPKAASC